MFKWRSFEILPLLLGLAVMLILSVGLHFLLKNKPKRLRNLPFQIISVFVLGLEIAKQCYYMFSSYTDLYILPLHFCSLFISIYPLAHFTNEKISNIFKPMAFCYSIVVLCLGYAFPGVLLGNTCEAPFSSFLSFHAFFYHFCIFFYPFLSIALNDYKPKKYDFLYSLLGVTLYCAYAVPGAYLLNINYANILASTVSLLESYRLWAGQVVYDISLFVIAALGMMLISLLYYLIYTGIEKIFKKRRA